MGWAQPSPSQVHALLKSQNVLCPVHLCLIFNIVLVDIYSKQKVSCRVAVQCAILIKRFVIRSHHGIGKEAGGILR